MLELIVYGTIAVSILGFLGILVGFITLISYQRKERE